MGSGVLVLASLSHGHFDSWIMFRLRRLDKCGNILSATINRSTRASKKRHSSALRNTEPHGRTAHNTGRCLALQPAFTWLKLTYTTTWINLRLTLTSLVSDPTYTYIHLEKAGPTGLFRVRGKKKVPCISGIGGPILKSF